MIGSGGLQMKWVGKINVLNNIYSCNFSLADVLS